MTGSSEDGITPNGLSPLDGDQSLDPRSVTAARIAGGILTVAIAFPAFVGLGVAVVAAPWGDGLRLGLVVGWVVLTLTAAVASYVWPAARYRRTRYRVDQHGLTIRRGIFWRSETFVPRSRIQHTDVLQGPLQRQFELASLIVHTAGTQDASVPLGGLSYHVALPIRDLLIGASRADDSV